MQKAQRTCILVGTGSIVIVSTAVVNLINNNAALTSMNKTKDTYNLMGIPT